MIETLLNTTLYILKSERVSDGQGGWTEDHVYYGQSILGRVRPKSASERAVAGSEYAEISHVVYTLDPLERGDWIGVGEDLILEVVAVRNPSLLDHHYEIDCKEIQRKASTISSGGGGGTD